MAYKDLISILIQIILIEVDKYDGKGFSVSFCDINYLHGTNI